MEYKKLKDCCTIIAGQSPESKYYNTVGDGLPFFQGKTDFGEVYPQIRVYCSQPTKIAEKDDVLLSVRAPVGPTNLSPGKVCIGRGLTAIRPDNTIILKYLLHFFRYFEAQLSSKGTGTTFKAITQDVVKNITMPIPPLSDQERIVARIEELFSELDKAVETLQTTKQQLAVYRQAVLKEALNNKKWKVYSIGDIVHTEEGDRGKNYPKRSDYSTEGYCLFLSAQNVRPLGWSFFDKIFITKEKHELLHGGTMKRGDLVITTRGTLGNVAVYDDAVPYEIVRINSCMLILRCDEKLVSPYYLSYFIMSPMFRSLIQKQKSGTAQPQIPAKQFKELKLYLPDLSEQNRIVKEIESRLSVCDSIEQTVDTALAQADAMRQSILKQAFEGRLV